MLCSIMVVVDTLAIYVLEEPGVGWITCFALIFVVVSGGVPAVSQRASNTQHGWVSLADGGWGQYWRTFPPLAGLYAGRVLQGQPRTATVDDTRLTGL